MDYHELLSDYSQGADVLVKVLKGVTDTQLDEVPIPDTWCIRQVVCHLADGEIVYADRMKRVLVEDNPTVFEWSPDDSVRDEFCRHRDIDNEVAVIASVRCQMLSILEQQDVEVWQRTAVHSQDGPMTLETLLERIAGHIPHHCRFIEQKRAAMSEA
jgi:uncharacterized damage-inducible protein DinB